MRADVQARTSVSRRVGRTIATVALLASFAAGIVGLMLVLSGRFESKVGGPADRIGKPERALKTEEATGLVKAITRPRRESAVGTIRAMYEAVVASKLLARVEEVRVTAGQVVKQGDVLLVLDKADLLAKLEQARAAVTAAQARLEQAEVDQKRAQNLRVRESSTQSELDRANTALRTAKAELEGTRRAEEEARIVESYATIRAPMGGRVVNKKVNAGDTVSPGQPLLTMYDPGRMQLVATVRESLALRLEVGQAVPARIDTLDLDCHATISEIVPEAQAESRSFQVKVTGPCPPNVYSGMFGRIFIPLEDEKLLVVPAEAVRQVGQLDEVDVVEGGKRLRRAVQLGRSFDHDREVLSGLKAGERVVLQRPGVAAPGGSRP